ncbi:cell wall protein, partial [Pyxidicoccus sp. 3LG]
MSVDKAFRDMIRNEIEVQLKPLRDVVSRLESGTADLDALRNVAERLAPLAEVVGPLFGAQAPAGKAAPCSEGRCPHLTLEDFSCP